MKLKDFYGKWFLREGDLRPEMINDLSIKRYKLGIKHFDVLNDDGLIFDNQVKAMRVSDTLRSVASDIKNGSTAFEDELVEAEKDKRPRVYISGPISGHNMEECRVRFNLKERELVAKGYRVFNPLKNGLPFDADTHKHMRRDLNILTNEDDPFDYIYMMKRWPHSAGCRRELETAIDCGITVMFEEVGDTVKFE